MITAIVSAYYCHEWLENRIKNLLDQDEVPAIYAMSQVDSKESEILLGFPRVINILTHGVPTVYQAWNELIKASSGEYIIVANSDDRLAKSATFEMKEVLDNDPTIGLVYGDFYVVTEEHGEPVQHVTLRDPESDLLDGCYIGHYPMWRRSLHDRYGYFDEQYRIASDYEMWLRFQKNGVKFHHIKKPLGTFWNRGDNLEFKQNNRLIWEQARIKRKYAIL